MSSTGVETVQRLRVAGGTTPARHGERGTEVPVPIKNCTLVPRTSSEAEGNQDTVIVGYTLVAPPGTDLVATDRIEARGDKWSIDGEPGDYRTRRGRAKAVIAALKRVTG